MGTARYPVGASDEAAEESTVSDEEWPVAEQYRVETPVAPADDGTVVLSQDAVAPPAPRRRFPPDFGRGVAAGLVGVLLLLLLIPAGIWLATRSAADAADAGTGGPTQTPPPATTSDQQPPPTAPSTKAVPDATGRTLPQARELLEGAGFRVRFERVGSARPRDEVVGQEPQSGAEAEPRSFVVLTVSGGPRRIAVPDVEGMSARDGAELLRGAGLDSRTSSIPSDERPGTVVEQTPAAGEEVSEGTLVALHIAAPTTPQPATQRVPDLVGTRSADARSRLRGLGLRFTQRPVESQRPAGEVVSQSPRAGAALREGGTVTLRISTDPPGVELPDVVGIDEANAIGELETAGFVVRVVDQPTFDPAEDGIVIEQSPPGGATGRAGRTVTITVARLS